jgi:acyl-homoserine lactone acylase PvdQ
MVITREGSASGHPLLVGGPQMSYFRPNLFMEFDARTVDNRFQITGVSLPGLFVAAFAGSGHDGVWTPTSAIGKTSDLFVEKLCSPDAGAPVGPESKYYWHMGECKPMRLRPDNGTPFTIHGPVIAWEEVAGEPVAITKKSYNAERIAQGIFPYYLLAKGKAKTAEAFVDLMQHHTLALNYAYINATEVAYINTGLYPVRAAGAQTDLPTWGTGPWDWQGVIPLARRPHAVNPPGGYLLSWNNQSAPGFYQSDGDFQRVQMLRRLVESNSPKDLPSLAQVSQTAALQDGYALAMLPLLMDFTQGAPLAGEVLSEMLTELTGWVEQREARRIDLDRDGFYDDAGPAIMDEIMICLKQEMEDGLQIEIGPLNLPGAMGSAYQDGTTSVLRMLLHRAKANGDNPAHVQEDRLQ